MSAAEEVNVLIVGGGPAGLMCGARLSELGVGKILIIDSGSAVADRHPDRPADLVCGQGGAGLYSDGKFSFAPAGKMAYQLSATIPLAEGRGDRRVTSADAYESVRRLFTSYPGREAPALCTTAEGKQSREHTTGFLLKPYHSVYLSLRERIEMIERLTDRAGVEFRPNAHLSAWQSADGATGHHRFSATVQSTAEQSPSTIRCRWLVLAGGRFGPLSIKAKGCTARRIEFGVRIELPIAQGLFAGRADHLIDPKFIHVDGEGVEYRTFCVCRNGQSIVARFEQEYCVSGSGEGPASGFHNVGFNVRLQPDHPLFERVRGELGFFQGRRQQAFRRVSHEELGAATGTAHYGEAGLAILLRGVDRLCKEFPEFCRDSLCFSGPTIEGVGLYPSINANTLEHTKGSFVIGDACGIFRGTVPSMLSGAFVAEQIALEDKH